MIETLHISTRALRTAALSALLAAAPAFALALPSATTRDTEQIDEVVRTWAQSWDRGDVAQYLDQYARNFVPTGGLSRNQWEQQRRARLKNSGIRHLMLRNLQVAIKADTAQAEFIQHYVDMDLLSTARKRLTLVRQAGTWKISEERVEAERMIRR